MGFEDTLNNMFPVSWLDPYGQMPLNKDYSVQIDITQVETDDGIKVTAVKTPPHAPTTSIQDVLSMVLGMGCCENEAPTNSQQSADLGKHKRENNKDSDKKEKESDTMESNSSSASRGQGSQPWAGGKSEEPRGTSEAAGSQ